MERFYEKEKIFHRSIKNYLPEFLFVFTGDKRIGTNSSGWKLLHNKKDIIDNSIDISHFTFKAWNQGKRFRPVVQKKPLEEVLVLNSSYQSHKLRLRLISEGYFERKCYNCQLRNWLDNPHHIDGDHFNNLIENLTLLCPNCHAISLNYRGKNKLGSALPVKGSPN